MCRFDFKFVRFQDTWVLIEHAKDFVSRAPGFTVVEWLNAIGWLFRIEYANFAERFDETLDYLDPAYLQVCG